MFPKQLLPFKTTGIKVKQCLIDPDIMAVNVLKKKSTKGFDFQTCIY